MDKYGRAARYDCRARTLIHLTAIAYECHPKRGTSLEMSGSREARGPGNRGHLKWRHTGWVLRKGVSAQWLRTRFGSSSVGSTDMTRCSTSSTDACRCSAP